MSCGKYFRKYPVWSCGVYFTFYSAVPIKVCARRRIPIEVPWDTIFDYDVRPTTSPVRIFRDQRRRMAASDRVSVSCSHCVQRLSVAEGTLGPNLSNKIVIPQTSWRFGRLRAVFAEKMYSDSRGILDEAMDQNHRGLTG